MPYSYYTLFRRLNEERGKRGLMTLTWTDFVSRKNPDLTKLYRRQLKDYIEPDPPRSFKRPAAVYDNKTPYDKYEV